MKSSSNTPTPSSSKGYTMKQTVSNRDFVEAFRAYGRLDNFSYEALDLLFNYFEECEEGTGQEIELDVVAICCEYCEDSVEGIADNYSIDLSECEDDDEKRQTVFDYISDRTCVVGDTATGFVYLAF